MVRYPSVLYGGRKGPSQKWIYIVATVLIVIVLIIFYSYKSGKSKKETAEALAGPSLGNKTAEEKAKSWSEVAQQDVKSEPNLLKTGVNPPAGSDSNTAGLIAEAVSLINANPNRIIEARDRLNELLPMSSSQQRTYIKEQLSALADKWLFSKTFFSQDRFCSNYKVKPGDRFSSLSEQFKVPYEILMEINKISRPEGLQAGETIKVINGPFHARVYRSTFTMDLYLQNTFVRSFSVGLGQPGKETPRGLWRVKVGGKLEKPIWTDPTTGRTYHPENPDYPLGSRWIGLEGLEGETKGRTGFAIHGTNEPSQIGSNSSQGCIRLHNGDAVLMYNLLMPGLSNVEVVD